VQSPNTKTVVDAVHVAGHVVLADTLSYPCRAMRFTDKANGFAESNIPMKSMEMKLKYRLIYEHKEKI